MENSAYVHKGNVGIICYLLKGDQSAIGKKLGEKLRAGGYFDTEGPFKELCAGEMLTFNQHHITIARSLGLLSKDESLEADEALLLFPFPPEHIRSAKQALESIVPELAGKLVEAEV